MVAHRHQRPPIASAQQIGRRQIEQHDIGEHHVEVLAIAGKLPAEQRNRCRQRAGGPAGEPLCPRKEILQDELEARVAMAR